LVRSFGVFEPVNTGLGLGPSLSRPKDWTTPDIQTLAAIAVSTHVCELWGCGVVVVVEVEVEAILVVVVVERLMVQVVVVVDELAVTLVMNSVMTT
jgi:hypothetical protein